MAFSEEMLRNCKLKVWQSGQHLPGVPENLGVASNEKRKGKENGKKEGREGGKDR